MGRRNPVWVDVTLTSHMRVIDRKITSDIGRRKKEENGKSRQRLGRDAEVYVQSAEADKRHEETCTDALNTDDEYVSHRQENNVTDWKGASRSMHRVSKQLGD